MAIQLLPICSTPKQAIRDGYTGANAHIYVPFSGYWFASGQSYTFPSDTNVQQNQKITIDGTTKPDTFQKDCCHC